MRLQSFFVKYTTFFLLLFLSTLLSANTLVNEKRVGVKGVKSTFEIPKKKTLKAPFLRLDFQQIIAAQKEQIPIPTTIENQLDKLTPKVVIDDVVVFLDNNNSLEGMMVYQGAPGTIQPSNGRPTYSPG